MGKIQAANHNFYAHASNAKHIQADGNKSLSEWKSATGLDAQSTELVSSSLNNATIFYNETTQDKTFALNGSYTDLQGNAVGNSLTLKPFTSQVLIKK